MSVKCSFSYRRGEEEEVFQHHSSGCCHTYTRKRVRRFDVRRLCVLPGRSYTAAPSLGRRVERFTHPPTPYSLLAVERGLNAQWRWYTWLCPENVAMQGLTLIHLSALREHPLEDTLRGICG